MIDIFHQYVNDYRLNIGTYMKSIYELYHEENDHVDVNYIDSNKMDFQKTLPRQMIGQTRNRMEPI